MELIENFRMPEDLSKLSNNELASLSGFVYGASKRLRDEILRLADEQDVWKGRVVLTNREVEKRCQEGRM